MLIQSMEQLLQDKRVLAEIDKHKWFESQKVGHDIGFEKAAKDWINRYGRQWAAAHGYQGGSTAAKGASMGGLKTPFSQRKNR